MRTGHNVTAGSASPSVGAASRAASQARANSAPPPSRWALRLNNLLRPLNQRGRTRGVFRLRLDRCLGDVTTRPE
ncbi:hypothetical protein chiPu_0025795 [Chiloscyllium punctatum]|uniref:Uncharacterized protein n=1 Tax=Chiloscyllium punctatum TaxID=137246 RepID=A0A401TGV7_CHIPU|nr:hypothetical protein [Chiloscyllium punctatum]